jgi:hypothetical protein
VQPSELIDKYIAGISGWRGNMLTKLRKLIHEVDPEITEEWKWDTPVFTHNGMVCAVGVFKDHVKLNFFKGALLPDSKKLFNAGLDAKKTRAIDFSEDDRINDSALKDLIREAVSLNIK